MPFCNRAKELADLQSYARANAAVVLYSPLPQITELPEPMAVEGLLRQHVQQLSCGFCFIGSRRRLLLDMFRSRRRPFYQSALLYPLAPISADEFAPFLRAQFTRGGKTLPAELAQALLGLTLGHPYYTQKLGFFLYERSRATVHADDLPIALAELLANETPVYESTLQALAPRQVGLLRAIAAEPTPSVFAMGYLARHNLGSTGAVQGALRRLTALDLIEQVPPNQSWHLVDPMLQRWLNQRPL